MTIDHGGSEPWRRVLGMRRAMLEQLAPPPLAWSADGRTFGFRCAVDHEVVAGDHVLLEAPDGSLRIGLVRSKVVEEAAGPQMRVDTRDAGGPVDAISDVTMAVRVRSAVGEGDILASLVDGRVVIGESVPFDEALFGRADESHVGAVLDALDAGRPTLEVGAVAVGTGHLPARLRTAGFNRHTFVCGQSGSGKTFSLGVVLERLVVETDLRIVVLDPNGDFVRLDTLRPSDDVQRTRRIPQDDDADARFRARHAAVVESGGIVVRTSDTVPPAVRLVDLSPAAQAAVFRLDPLQDRYEYAEAIGSLARLRDAIVAGVRGGAREALAAIGAPEDPVRRDLMTRVLNLGLGDWSVWAGQRPSLVDALESDARATVADLGSLTTDEERLVAALGVLEHLWSTRERRIPTMVVIDEAHTVAPNGPVDPVGALVRDLLVRIAGEGRKFGLFLLLASQRPDKVHPSVLSQCDNLVLLRMNSARDIEDLVDAFSFVPPDLVRSSRTFGQGEAVVAGPIVPGPTVLRFGGRYTAEGGSDLPTTWASPSD